MRPVTSMLNAYPKDLDGVDKAKLAACITACFECAQACTACADACLAEDSVADLTRCIRSNLNCAEVCTTTGNVLSRHTGDDTHITLSALRHCWMVCKACGDECAQHAQMHEHCRICAEACRRVEQACMDLITSLA